MTAAKTARKGLVWGSLGRGQPGSWMLIRAKDGRVLALSETCGGVLRTAHAIWQDLDASQIEAGGVRMLRDEDGGIVAAVTPKERAEDVRSALSDIHQASRPNDEPRENLSMQPEKTNAKALRKTRTADTDADAAERAERSAPSGKSRRAQDAQSTTESARKKNAPTTIHIIAPPALRAQVDALRSQIEEATTIRPTTTDVVKRALELGLAQMSLRFTPNA